MGRIFGRTAALAAVVTLAVAAPAFASGGTSGGGGGTSGGGGAPAPAPAPAASTCIWTFSGLAGTFSGSAAIWTQFSLLNTCGTNSKWTMTFTNDATGVTEMSRSGNWTSLGGFDDVHAQYDTPYTVTLSVISSTGALVDSRSLDITTTHGGT